MNDNKFSNKPFEINSLKLGALLAFTMKEIEDIWCLRNENLITGRLGAGFPEGNTVNMVH